MTNKERAKWFKQLYDLYVEQFNNDSEIGECPMDEVSFNDKLQSIVSDEWRTWD